MGVTTTGESAGVISAALDAVALTSLRIGLALMAIAAATDTVFTATSDASIARVLEGVLFAAAATAGAARPRRAAAVLCPRGRIVLLAALFALIGAIDTSLQSHYAETTVVVVWIAAIVASPRWILACVAVSVLGVLIDYAAQGQSLAWMLMGAGQDDVANQIVDLCVNAALVVAALSVLRGTLTSAPAALREVRDGGESLTPALAAVVREQPLALLGRADPGAVIASLSESEQRVLSLLADGLLPKQAAVELGVKLPTVRSHIAAAKRKTGARTLEQLVGLYAEAHS
jgi:DNA-binding CsgD family transcriptional regulator